MATSTPTGNHQTEIIAGRLCRKNIMEKIDKRLDYATTRRTRTLPMRMDVQLPNDVAVAKPKEDFMGFMNSLRRYFKEKQIDEQDVWVAEVGRKNSLHWHCQFFLDGHKTKSIVNHLKRAEKLWAKRLGVEDGKGLIDHCTQKPKPGQVQNGTMLDRNDPDYEAKKKAVRARAAYLAKPSTKGIKAPKEHEVGCSRLPKQKEEDQNLS